MKVRVTFLLSLYSQTSLVYNNKCAKVPYLVVKCPEPHQLYSNGTLFMETKI